MLQKTLNVSLSEIVHYLYIYIVFIEINEVIISDNYVSIFVSFCIVKL